jgi:tetratricopeptide (TPR) repeat protein
MLVATGAAATLISRAPSYREWRYVSMSLAALQQARAGSGHNDPICLYYLGVRLNRQSRFAEADPVLRRAVGLDPAAARLRDAWARALTGSGNMTSAFGELREFAGDYPHRAIAHRLLSEFYVSQNSMRRAAEELTTAATQDPHDPQTWSCLAIALDALQQYAPACDAAQHVVTLRPEDAGSRLQLAIEQAHLNQPDARSSFARATALAPHNMVAHREYANWLLRTSTSPADLQLALSEAQEAVTLDSQDAGSRLALGTALARSGDSAGALAAFRVAADLVPTAPSPAHEVWQTLIRLGRQQEAATWRQVYLQRKRRADLKAGLWARLERNPHDSAAHSRLAQLYAEEGDVVDCMRHEGEALRRPPDSPPSLGAAANCLTTAGYALCALPIARRAVDLAPRSPDALEAVGNALLAAGHPRDAAAWYDRARVYQPEKYHDYLARLAAWLHRHREQTVIPAAEQAYRASRALVEGQVGPLHISPEAERLAQKAVSLSPANPHYLRYLMTLEFERKHIQAFRTAATQLLAVTPNDARAHALLAISLLDGKTSEGDLHTAEAHLQAAQNDAAAEPTWRYGLGLLAMKQHDFAKAARELRKALEIDPGPSVTWYKLAQAEQRLGHAQAASKCLAECRKREEYKLAESAALRAIAAHPEDGRLYAKAEALLRSHGSPAEAAAVRAVWTQRLHSGEAQKVAQGEHILPSAGVQ